jgi:hypothetical protein
VGGGGGGGGVVGAGIKEDVLFGEVGVGETSG